jgi:diguanylate cyclase (GGDEF)-like protein
VLCAAAWLAADLGTNNDYSHPLLPIWNSLVRLGIFLIVTILVARLQDNIEKEWTAARIDSLTGLFNSRYFIETATREMEGSRRYNRPLCLVFMDIDGFKNINDTFGHSEGDKLLQVVADVLKNNIRTTDILARLGGDEFTIMLAETDEAVSRVLLERIKEGLLEAVTVRGWSVSFSFGVAAFESMPSSFDELLGHADGLMYQAKKEGKGGAVFRKFS